MAIVALMLACLLTRGVEMGGLTVSKCFLGLLAVRVGSRFVKSSLCVGEDKVYILRAVPVEMNVGSYSLVDLVMLVLGNVEGHVKNKVVLVVDEFDWRVV